MTIKELRQKKGLSQRAFADLIGSTQQTLSSWETGRTSPPDHIIQRIATSLDIDPAEIKPTKTDEPETELIDYAKKLFSTIDKLSAVMDDCMDENDTNDLKESVIEIIKKLIQFTDNAVSYAQKPYRLPALETFSSLQWVRITSLIYQSQVYGNLADHFGEESESGFDAIRIRDRIDEESSNITRVLHDSMLYSLNEKRQSAEDE